MSERRLVTGRGDCSVSVWDVSDGYSKLYSYSPLSESRRKSAEAATTTETSTSGGIVNSWSPDASCIASCVRGSSKIIMTYSKNKVLTSAEIPSPLNSVVVVQFPRTTRKSLFVGNSREIVKFDVAKQKVRKEYNSRNSLLLTCLAIDHRDQHLAAGTADSKIVLINAVTSTSVVLDNDDSGGTTTTTTAVTAVRYNNVKHSMLGSSSDSGSVAFWDCNAGRKLRSFSQHRAPCTGLAFSPVNEMLVLSAGLDKRCVCYDTTVPKKPVSTIKTPFPLTAVDFHQDGFILALGTSKGKVLLYDLRSYVSPMKIIDNDEDGAIHSLLFSPPKALILEEDFSKKKTISKENIIPFETQIQTPQQQQQRRVIGKDDSISSQVFSPLRNEWTSSPLNVTGENPMSSSSISGTTTKIGASVPTSSSFRQSGSSVGAGTFTNLSSSESIFSPLREGSINISSSNILRTPLTSFEKSASVGGTPVFSPMSSIQEEDNDRRVTDVGASILLAEKQFNSEKEEEDCDDEGEEEANRTPLAADGHEDLDHQQESGEETNVRAIINAFPSQMIGQSTETERKAEKTSSSSETSATTAAEVFHHSYFQAVIQEAMEEYTFDMRRHLWNMQYDMIRSFNRQYDEMNELMKAYSLNDELIEENRRLQRENDSLKRSY